MAAWEPIREQAVDLAEKLIRYFADDAPEDRGTTSLGYRRSSEFLALLRSGATHLRDLEAFAESVETEAQDRGSAFYELSVWARRVAQMRRNSDDKSLLPRPSGD